MLYRINVAKESATQCVKVFLSVALVMCALVSSSLVFASPGAHGPNGEHLDMEQGSQQALRPKFEAFTESFELLGELFPEQLIVYLHDFETNVPVVDASLELESGALSVSARFDEALNHYVIKNPDFIEQLNTSGEHEVVITVLTEDSGDLLVANLTIVDTLSNQTHLHEEESQHEHDTDHHDGEHHHFPWWAIGLSIVLFIVGYVFGRKNKGAAS